MKKEHESITKNIRETIAKLKRDKVCGISVQNLKQITPTKGVLVSVAEYHREFETIARDCAKKAKFEVLS